MPDESTDTKIAVMQNDMGYIKHMIEQVDSKLDKNYVTKEEFLAKTQKYDIAVKVVFGLVGFILVAVLGAVINLVINRGQP